VWLCGPERVQLRRLISATGRPAGLASPTTTRPWVVHSMANPRAQGEPEERRHPSGEIEIPFW